MQSYHFHYQSFSTDLCWIGRKYDTDKSSQRDNVSDHCDRHCHPYSIFYDALFKFKRDAPIVIAELGILRGASLRMWAEYFPNARIYGFDHDVTIIKKFQESPNIDLDRVCVGRMDVTDPLSITNGFAETKTMFDVIIDDTTHEFHDQINIIKHARPFLKPGGVLIVEDIFKRYSESNYHTHLIDILPSFQRSFFLSLDHVRCRSTGWNNDKLLVLIASGAQPIFPAQQCRVTLVTPSCCPQNLKRLKESIPFDQIAEWVIIYDGTCVAEDTRLFTSEPKIKEFVFTGPGLSGNPQRNFALDLLTSASPDSSKSGFIYFVDDDNVIHPEFFNIMPFINDDTIFTFNQLRGNTVFPGNRVLLDKIDTAMFVIPIRMCRTVRWEPGSYNADGHFIVYIFNASRLNWIYANDTLCYYNMQLLDERGTSSDQPGRCITSAPNELLY